MELTVLNNSFLDVGTIDVFDSLIWTDRYLGAGDFEIVAPPVTGIVATLSASPYLALDAGLLPGSDRIMITEQIDIHADTESGDKVTVRGRSLESILDRRIIWSLTTLSGNFQLAIKKLLDENAISPIDTARTISRLIFEESDDAGIIALTIDTQVNGTSLYDTILSLCQSKNIAFKITLNSEGKFVFKLYAGEDRSYDQTENTFVVFSPGFDNLINSDYKSSSTALKTITKVIGNGDTNELVTFAVEAPGGAETDLARREMLSDATSITRVPFEGTVTDEEYKTKLHDAGDAYIAQLQQKGTEDLATAVIVQTFDGQIDPSPTGTYVYNRDFFLGDIVQVADNYGNESKSQTTELIHSQDGDGPKVYPTFSAVI